MPPRLRRATVDLNVDWLLIGESYDSSVPTGEVTLDSYNRFDIVGTWTPTDSLSLWLAVDNVFDEGYEESVGFPGIGARARVGFNYSL